jgi:DNA-binding transcriptional MerR regulator
MVRQTGAANRLHEDEEARLPRYTPRAVARRLGVPTATLRSWNQRYGIGPASHRPGQHRLYSEADVAVVQLMHSLIGQGVTPRSAAQSAMENARPALTDAAVVLDAALALDAATVGRVLHGHLRHYGVIDTWERLIRPAFRAIDARQANGEGCVDVEHVLSWMVTATLHRIRDVTSDVPAAILLACTEDETHTLALEALRGALAEHQCSALMLGASTPTDAIIAALRTQSLPATVVLFSQTARTSDVRVVQAINSQGAQLILAGPGWDQVGEPDFEVRVNGLDEALRKTLAAAPLDSRAAAT